MTTRVVKNPEQMADLQRLLGSIEKLPITVSWVQGKDRTGEQNRTAFMWYKEIAEQLGDRDAASVRAECKLNIGVRMMVTEDEAFRATWHRLMLHQFTYEQKLEFMVEPMDMPITRLMSTTQMTRYLEGIIQLARSGQYPQVRRILTMPAFIRPHPDKKHLFPRGCRNYCTISQAANRYCLMSPWNAGVAEVVRGEVPDPPTGEVQEVLAAAA